MPLAARVEPASGVPGQPRSTTVDADSGQNHLPQCAVGQNEMTVERGTVDDADSVADLWVELATEQQRFGSHVRPESNRTAIRDEVARYAATDRLLVVRDEEVVGFATFGVEDGTYGLDVVRGVVENIYVKRSYRNEGIGSALLARAERRLDERGVDVVALETLACNDDARRFYRQHGYETHRVELEKPVESDNHSKEDG